MSTNYPVEGDVAELVGQLATQLGISPIEVIAMAVALMAARVGLKVTADERD